MKLPNALEMQEWRYGDRPVADRDRLAEALRDAGRRSDALLLFDGRPDHPFVAEEKRWAIADGVSFQLFSIRNLGGAVSDDDLRACAQAAERLGRFLDARRCYEALGDDAAIQKIADQLPLHLRPAQPSEE